MWYNTTPITIYARPETDMYVSNISPETIERERKARHKSLMTRAKARKSRKNRSR